MTPLPALHRVRRRALFVALIGLALAVVGAFFARDHFWRAYLLAYTFWLEIALGCLGLLMLHHLVGGRWSAHIRRLMESAAMTLPLLALLFVPLLFGLTTLYPWMNPDYVQQSDLLQQKRLYLNLPFFLARAALYFLIWIGLAYLLNRWSLAQEQRDDPRWATRMRRISTIGMILYVLTATFAAYDWLMSLEPEWFSSIYGLLFISGQGIAAFALAIIGLRFVARNAPAVQDWSQTFNDLGNFLLGVVMIWAYFSFSQFLIIWTANIPEEAIWYYRRSQGGWLSLGVVLVALHFVLPFFLLLSRRVKRQAEWLTVLALILFAARLVDLFWLLMPAFYPDALPLHWLDPLLLIAMGGAWFAFFVWQWQGRSLVPIHDPHLGNSYEQHQSSSVRQASQP